MTEILFAPTEMVDSYRDQCRLILDALGIGRAFVSDQTLIGDFGLPESSLSAISVTLAIDIRQDSLLWRLAESLSNRVEQS